MKTSTMFVLGLIGVAAFVLLKPEPEPLGDGLTVDINAGGGFLGLG